METKTNNVVREWYYSELKMDELIEKTDTYCMIADVILKIKRWCTK